MEECSYSALRDWDRQGRFPRDVERLFSEGPYLCHRHRRQSQHAERAHKTFIADQSRRDQLQKFIDKFGGNFDVLLDDGGHSMDQQQISLGYLFKFVKPGGYYILEDIHTSLTSIRIGYGVEPDGANSTLAMIERFVRSVPPRFESKYMLPEEMQYLNENVEFANLNFRNNAEHSIVCIFKKKQKH
jgi:hypothetical protein